LAFTKNLTEVLQAVFKQEYLVVKETLKPVHAMQPNGGAENMAAAMSSSSLTSNVVCAAEAIDDQALTAAQAARQTRIRQTQELHAAGMDHKTIAKRLHIHSRTVARVLNESAFYVPPGNRKPTILMNYSAHLRDRYAAGYTNARRLCAPS